MEALSRGAETVKFIERDKEAALSIAKSLSKFGKEDSSGEVVCADANEWIRKNKETFDIIFIDPPFSADSIYKTCHKVEETALAKKLIYLEWHSEIESSLLPEKWELLKHKKSGSVFFALCLKC